MHPPFFAVFAKFAACMSSTLPISETFVSLQGEGRLTGTPSWFVRTSGCNLRCVWCDTPYASWHPEVTTRTLEDLLEDGERVMREGFAIAPSPGSAGEVPSLRGGGGVHVPKTKTPSVAQSRDTSPAEPGEGASGSVPVRHAVLTGGEPMMFDALAPFTHALRERGWHITIETAGTLRPEPRVHADLMSISPKLRTSTPSAAQASERRIAEVWAGPGGRHDQRRINLASLQALLDDHPAPSRQLKFVMTSERDLVEIDDLLARLRGVTASDVMLMPEGVTVPTSDRAAQVQAICDARGFTYCRRLHIELYGNTRGT